MIIIMANERQPRSSSTTLWYGLSDANLAVWFENFGKTVSEHEAVLGIDAGELEVIQDAGNDFTAKLYDAFSAKLAAETATAVKNETRTSSIDAIRPFVASFQANPQIPEAVYGLLDIPRRGTQGSRGAAITPSNVLAVANVNGSITIKFDRNGNPKSCNFVVQHFSDGTWLTVASGTRTRYNLTGYPVGVEARFRVIATRGDSASEPSAQAIVWGANQLSIQLEAA